MLSHLKVLLYVGECYLILYVVVKIFPLPKEIFQFEQTLPLQKITVLNWRFFCNIWKRRKV